MSEYGIINTINNFDKYVRWFRTSPIAWFGGILIALIILKIVSYFLTDKSGAFDNYFKKIRVDVVDENEPKESKGERMSRVAAKKIFGVDFIKIRPDILKNNVTNHNLELDLYNEELKLAIEYSGRQHYKYVPFFHKNYEDFLNQKYRDEIKKMLCKKNDIMLIEIPYTVKHEDIETFIRIESRKLNFKV
jgi:hypothetical protein